MVFAFGFVHYQLKGRADFFPIATVRRRESTDSDLRRQPISGSQRIRHHLRYCQSFRLDAPLRGRSHLDSCLPQLHQLASYFAAWRRHSF